MFVTQVNHLRRSRSSNFTQSTKTLKPPSLEAKRLSNVSATASAFRTQAPSIYAPGTYRQDSQISTAARVTPQQRWGRMVQMFEDTPLDPNVAPSCPNFYKCLLKSDLQKQKFMFKVPQTALTDEDGTIQLLHSPHGHITKQPIAKSEVVKALQSGHSRLVSALTRSQKRQTYARYIDLKVNPTAPLLVIRYEEGQGSLQVQNLRNFGENRWRATTESLVQRFIYSRNLKAMVLRAHFERAARGQQHQEYSVSRFQNVSSILRDNFDCLKDSHDLRSKVSPLYARPNTMEHTKIAGPGVLKKVVGPSNEVKRMIEKIVHKHVLKMSVDFVEDLTGELWVIGFRGVEFEEVPKIVKKDQWLVASQVGSCRLCNGIFHKSELKNNVSVRMLLQFLQHLRRRTRTQDQDMVDFGNALSLNRKQNAMSAVCECCYALIIHQLQLKKYEEELGRLCHIKVQDDVVPSGKGHADLRQWRLMVYLQDIKETGTVIKTQNVIVRYTLTQGLEEKWKCPSQEGTISVQRVKVHYFFSQTNHIEEFLSSTEILVSVLSQQMEQVCAQGSTGVLANFKHKFSAYNGQRQTTTVLLFFESGKYCELTLKVGLVYDGIYRAPDTPLKKLHSVLFPARDWLNSNPLPKEWMEMFGYGQEIQIKETKEQELFKGKNKENRPSRQRLKKKAIRFV